MSLLLLLVLACAADPSDPAGSRKVDFDGDGVAEGDDCDDQDSTIGVISTWFADRDRDGYGDATVSESACDPIDGYVLDYGDCDDDDRSANPGEVEVCDDVDNDCDQQVDEDATDAVVWCRDADGDGQGTTLDTVLACDDGGAGYVEVCTDCDDTDNNVYYDTRGSGDEVDWECEDDIDNDCDGTVNDGCEEDPGPRVR